MNTGKGWEKKRICFHNFKFIWKIHFYLVAEMSLLQISRLGTLIWRFHSNTNYEWIIQEAQVQRRCLCVIWRCRLKIVVDHVFPALEKGIWSTCLGQWKVCTNDVCHFLLEALKTSLCFSTIFSLCHKANTVPDRSSINLSQEIKTSWDSARA